MKDILHVKSLEKPFNKPNDTPIRRWDALKKVESIWFPYPLIVSWKYHSLVSDAILIDVFSFDKIHKSTRSSRIYKKLNCATGKLNTYSLENKISQMA